MFSVGQYVKFEDNGIVTRGILSEVKEFSSVIVLGNQTWEISNERISHACLPHRKWDYKNLPKIEQKEIEFLHCDLWFKYAISGTCKYKEQFYYYFEMPEIMIDEEDLSDDNDNFINGYGLIKPPDDVMNMILEDHQFRAMKHINGTMQVDLESKQDFSISEKFPYPPFMLFEPIMWF